MPDLHRRLQSGQYAFRHQFREVRRLPVQDLIEVAQRPTKMLGDGLHSQTHTQSRYAVRSCNGDDAHQLTGFIGNAWAG